MPERRGQTRVDHEQRHPAVDERDACPERLAQEDVAAAGVRKPRGELRVAQRAGRAERAHRQPRRPERLRMLPSVRIIVAGVRKIPTPTTCVTTIAVAAHVPSRRMAGCPTAATVFVFRLCLPSG